MKNIFYLFLFTAFTTIAQNYTDDKQVITTGNLQTANAQLSLVATPNITTVITNQFVNQNSVFIEQIGANNNAQVSVASDDSQINIYQNGNLNNSVLYLSADRIRENITQIGNSNRVYDYSLHGAQNHAVDIIQNGNYNTTISVGANGISQKMKINQTSNGSSVYVLHF